jgi:hypothetical protein
LLCFVAYLTPLIIDYFNSNNGIAAKLLSAGLSVVGYYVWFTACAFLLNRWRYRNWHGNWFYASVPHRQSKFLDQGVSWMRIFMNDNELGYVVERFDNPDELRLAMDSRRNFFKKVDQKRKSRGAHQTNATSESIVFDSEKNALIVFFTVEYMDEDKVNRKGRLELTIDGSISNGRANGKYSSCEHDPRDMHASHGRLFAFRSIDALEEFNRIYVASDVTGNSNR